MGGTVAAFGSIQRRPELGYKTNQDMHSAAIAATTVS